jgi:hypothetical protein
MHVVDNQQYGTCSPAPAYMIRFPLLYACSITCCTCSPACILKILPYLLYDVHAGGEDNDTDQLVAREHQSIGGKRAPGWNEGQQVSSVMINESQLQP